MEVKKAAIVLCICIFVISCVSFFFLPEQIPMHYNASGEINRYGNRIEIFLIPLISLVITALLIFLEKIDPKKRNIESFKKSIYIALFSINLYMLVILSVMICEGLYPNSININIIMILAVSVLFIVFGNILPKMKSNYIIGIRTPWTLEDDQIWFKTHRFGGKVWFIGGIVMMFGVVLPSSYLIFYILTITLVLGLLPCAYSFYIFKKRHPKGD